MRPLGLIVVAAAGRGRAALVTGSTALASGLLLVAISIIRLDYDEYSSTGPYLQLFGPIADPGTRPGVVFAVVLMLLPVLLLLDQAVRLGSTRRHRRYSALTVAGATRADLRRWAALEVGMPATVGALLGLPVWLLLRELLGVQANTHGYGALVPTTSGPGPWALVAIAGISAYGLLVGRRAGGQMAQALVGSRGLRRPPRPWAGLLLVAGLALLLSGMQQSQAYDVPIFGGLLLCVAGVAGLAPWAAYVSSRWLASRAGSAPTLLAARRLVADARPAGRAGAAVGAVALTGGVLGPYIADVRRSMDLYDRGYYLDPAFIIIACVAVGLLVIAASLAVHTTETLLERRREMAALVATGVPSIVVARAQRRECLIATLPLTVVGCVLSGLVYTWLLDDLNDPAMLGVVGLALAATTAAVLAAVWLTTLLMRRWLLQATDPENLRTE